LLIPKLLLSVTKISSFFFFIILLKYLVDATDSGSGNLQISIARDGKNIPNHVHNEGGVRYRISFTPDQSCIHNVHIKFNGIEIHGTAKFLLYSFEHSFFDK
jgi:hypothetical protein